LRKSKRKRKKKEGFDWILKRFNLFSYFRYQERERLRKEEAEEALLDRDWEDEKEGNKIFVLHMKP